MPRALYGFAVCACKGIDDSSVVNVSKKGKQKLIDFDEAVKRCQDASILSGQPLSLNDEQKRSITFLKDEFRNNFEHYIPQGWSIEVHSFPCLSIHILEIIDHLALNTHVLSHFRGDDEIRLRNVLKDSIDFLRQCRLHRDLQNAQKCRCKKLA
jgi:hypothetical protein